MPSLDRFFWEVILVIGILLFIAGAVIVSNGEAEDLVRSTALFVAGGALLLLRQGAQIRNLLEDIADALEKDEEEPVKPAPKVTTPVQAQAPAKRESGILKKIGEK